MSAFQVGDGVRALVTAQGMEVDALYTVADVEVHRLPFGDFVSYRLEPVEGKATKLWIGNGHLLLALCYSPADGKEVRS